MGQPETEGQTKKGKCPLTDLIYHCRVVQNSELDFITVRFNICFSDYSLAYDDSQEAVVSDRQYELYELILRMNKEQGLSYRKISAFFNASGVTTVTGKRWCETGSHAHSVIKRINQRKVRLEVRTFSTESKITHFSISSDS